jgi:hypothetical protein
MDPTWVILGAAVVMLASALVYAWRHRPYRGPGADTDTADEMAMRASKMVNRIHDMGADIGSDV